ncbi:FliM/FliN family flagellar motor switch protein [Roseateles sp. DAIF2]|uniref:FliM/FliN family flagellar motor switch protein n=1 Tax=Roseateles sp. DAIF2 TaxID=2714952 RepID=UPI0018A30098|nr:FliM/FliN family flagellar motor switch protein [Roseateles sp. DAIF2]QPF74670.1 FliM/FliN family flagellar motor switch protein [Roseateles sp. DAIF2]
MSRSRFLQVSNLRGLERLDAQQRDRLAERLLPVWRAWCERWGLAGAAVRVDPLVQGSARTRVTEAWTIVGRLGAGPVREAGHASMVRAAMDLGVGTAWSEDSLAEAFSQSVSASLNLWRSSWLGELRACEAGAQSQDDAALAELGELVFSFTCRPAGGDGVTDVREYLLRIDAAALPPAMGDGAAGRPGLAPLTPLPLAIAHLPVRVSVDLGQAALHFGQLADLHPGDVIPLEHPLARPADVRLDLDRSARLPVAARLGRQDGRWAICLDPQASPLGE